ncbi:21912_t:CDS:2 [Gigaspora margarita]|uniref:21912_t:CDS:1 n=1 Tax=Gigaspora margarita TaxID=4874 RepID=A0ABM8W3X9_GIGMA|nr:21912_t:CDS:2 [Gigaspora margarita]
MGVLGNILKSALNEGSFSSTEQVTKSIQQKLLNDQTLKQNQKKYLIDYLQKIGDEVSVHRQNGVKRQCEICKHSTYAKRYCEHCIHNYLRQHFKDWTSGNDMIDKIIQDCQQQTQQPHRVIEWIPFVNFKSVQRLTENSVYTAFWNNGSFANWNIEKQLLERHGGHPVTLKRLKDSNNNSSKWVREIKSHFLIDNTRQYLVQCFGMTKNPETLNFMLVMEKMDMDLRSFLRDNNHIITWEQKLKYVEIISLSLTVIHKAGYVHRDLHPGHTLIQLFNNRVIKFIKKSSVESSLNDNNLVSLVETSTHPSEDTVNEVDTFDESDELDEKSEISNNFREADDIIQQLPITTQQNLDGVYTSQFIDVNAISQRFSEEVKSGNITGKYVF